MTVALVSIISVLGDATGMAMLPISRAQESYEAQADKKDGMDPFIGMWDVVVAGFAEYRYTYTVARGSFVATGNIDGNWDGAGSTFGPTVGSYMKDGRRTYRIRERAWSFDPHGLPAGHSEFVGTYMIDDSGSSLVGEGTWTLFDASGTAIFSEPLTVTGTKLAP